MSTNRILRAKIGLVKRDYGNVTPILEGFIALKKSRWQHP